MSDNEGKGRDPIPTLICIEELINILDDGLALNAFVEFAKEGDGFLRARLAEAMGSVEEEIVASIGGSSNCGVQDGEVADAWEDKILEDGGGSGRGGDDKDARGFESGLSRGSPYATRGMG